jgi:cytochrome c oxidase subunit 2
VAALSAMAGCRFGAPAGATEQGQDIAGLYHLMFWIAIGVGGITLGLILYSVFRFRRRNEDLPKQTRYHVPLEITYTVIPILIVLFIFGATWRVENRVDHLDPNPAVTVDATAFQWQWRFTCPQCRISISFTPTRDPTFVVPVGEPIRIELRAEDVIHAFFVPQFLFKRDAIPGKLNEFDLTIPRPGTFVGECAEFCGLNHSDMGFSVKAVPRAEFDAWVRQQQAAASPSPSPSPSASTGVTPTPIASQAG